MRNGEPSTFAPVALIRAVAIAYLGAMCLTAQQGCSGDSPSTPTITTVDTVQGTIGPTGGDIAGPVGGPLSGVRLSVAPGVLSGPVEITLTLGDSIGLASVVASTPLAGDIVGSVVKISTTSTVAFPAVLTLPYSHTAVGNRRAGSILVFRRQDDGTLETIADTANPESPPTAIDTQTHTLTVEVDGFSTFSTVIPRSPLEERVRGQASVGCASGEGQLTAIVLDDQQVLKLDQRTSPVAWIVLHSTGSGRDQSLDDVLRWGYENDLCAGYACQAHYYIGRAGEVVRLVGEAFVAFHAADGRQPRVLPNANNVSIGVELFQHEPSGVVLDPEPFTDAQYANLRKLLGGLKDRYPGAVVDYHKVLDPSRRHDPTAFDAARIEAVGGCGQSVSPAAPSNLAVTAQASTGIDLAWTDNSTNEDGFRIERAPGNTTAFSEIHMVGPNVTTHQDVALSAGTSYSYRVRAFNAAGSSQYSNTVTGTTLLPNLSSTYTGTGVNTSPGSQQPYSITFTLIQSGTTITGTWTSGTGDGLYGGNLSGSVNGSILSIAVFLTGASCTTTLAGTLSIGTGGSHLTGDVSGTDCVSGQPLPNSFTLDRVTGTLTGQGSNTYGAFQPYTITFFFVQTGSTVTGTWASGTGDGGTAGTLGGIVNGSSLDLTLTIPTFNGGSPCTTSLTGTMTFGNGGTHLSGSVSGPSCTTGQPLPNSFVLDRVITGFTGAGNNTVPSGQTPFSITLLMVGYGANTTGTWTSGNGGGGGAGNLSGTLNGSTLTLAIAVGTFNSGSPCTTTLTGQMILGAADTHLSGEVTGTACQTGEAVTSTFVLDRITVPGSSPGVASRMALRVPLSGSIATQHQEGASSVQWARAEGIGGIGPLGASQSPSGFAGPGLSSPRREEQGRLAPR